MLQIPEFLGICFSIKMKLLKHLLFVDLQCSTREVTRKPNVEEKNTVVLNFSSAADTPVTFIEFRL